MQSISIVPTSWYLTSCHYSDILVCMQLTNQIKLKPTQAQADSLKRTLEKANAACDYISQVAWDTHIFGKFQLQKLVYDDVRKSFDLTAQLVIRCIAKVTDAYKLDTKVQRAFKPLGAIAYDQRILNWYTEKQFVSIWTVDGREKIPFVGGPRQLELLKHQKGESDLCLVDDEFYLLTTCEIEDLEPADVQNFLGVDLGEKNIATTSDGDIQTSEPVEKNRKRFLRLRSELQRVGTKSSRRRLKAIRRKQSRFQKDVNHQISKRLVETAKHTNRGIAVEDLTGITARTRVRGKERRAQRSNWHIDVSNVCLKPLLEMLPGSAITATAAFSEHFCTAAPVQARGSRCGGRRLYCAPDAAVIPCA